MYHPSQGTAISWHDREKEIDVTRRCFIGSGDYENLEGASPGEILEALLLPKDYCTLYFKALTLPLGSTACSEGQFCSALTINPSHF